jgi:hypothetical protein
MKNVIRAAFAALSLMSIGVARAQSLSHAAPPQTANHYN